VKKQQKTRKRRTKQIQEVEGAPCITAGYYPQQDSKNVRPSSRSSDIIDCWHAASNNQCFSNNIQDIMQLNALTWKLQTWFHFVMDWLLVDNQIANIRLIPLVMNGIPVKNCGKQSESRK
jgi:hypothetical protein